MSDHNEFLFPDIGRLLRRAFDERARAIGVTRPQWRVLLALSRREGINQGGLADILEVEPITLCRMVDRLQDAGLVERRADPADRRAWLLFLTEKAHPILTDLRDIGGEIFGQAMDGLSGAEQDTLNALLNRIRNNLSRRPTESTAHG
jgi:DNA-binding MarR family transcriptional regulator